MKKIIIYTVLTIVFNSFPVFADYKTLIGIKYRSTENQAEHSARAACINNVHNYCDECESNNGECKVKYNYCSPDYTRIHSSCRNCSNKFVSEYYNKVKCSLPAEQNKCVGYCEYNNCFISAGRWKCNEQVHRILTRNSGSRGDIHRRLIKQCSNYCRNGSGSGTYRENCNVIGQSCR